MESNTVKSYIIDMDDHVVLDKVVRTDKVEKNVNMTVQYQKYGHAGRQREKINLKMFEM